MFRGMYGQCHEVSYLSWTLTIISAVLAVDEQVLNEIKSFDRGFRYKEPEYGQVPVSVAAVGDAGGVGGVVGSAAAAG